MILRLEADKKAVCHVIKLKDSLWLSESSSFERLRIYLQVIRGKISGLRLIVPSENARFIRDVSHVALLPEEEKFMRTDIKDPGTPVEVMGASVQYDYSQTEIVLLFRDVLERGNYILILDLQVGGYKKSDILEFLLKGFRWTYESKNYGGQISDRDFEFVVGCRRMEMWIIPPHYRHFWKVEPDPSVSRCVEMTEAAISTLQKRYLISNARPVGRLAYQWEQQATFGEGSPSMISRVRCTYQMSPLILIMATASLGISLLVTLLSLFS